MARFATVCVLVLVLSGSDASNQELSVKTELVERFTRFVEWPAWTFRTSDAPFLICVAGEDPTFQASLRMLTRRRIKGRPVSVQKLRKPCEAAGCHLLFISPDAEPELWHVISHTTHQPILTVANAEGFAQRGVVLNLYREGNFMRFELNVRAARHSGLVMSSGLYRLARLVNAEEP